jgi:ankyrin repeat protein
VREGHTAVVEFLLEQGAYDPAYSAYPYKGETLVRMADDRNHTAIVGLLHERASRPGPARSPDGSMHGVGHIEFPRDDDRSRLEKLIGANAMHAVEALLDRRPDLVHDELVFYAEGVLAQAANRRTRQLLNLLLARGARVPDITKWGRFYYFKHADIAALLLDRGMNPDHMTWHRTTLLHDMAGEGNEEKAALLLKHGAALNSVDDEFRSTPLGFAARWGRRNIVRLLLDHGADPNAAGAAWATPLAWAEKKGHHDIARDLRAAGAR